MEIKKGAALLKLELGHEYDLPILIQNNKRALTKPVPSIQPGSPRDGIVRPKRAQLHPC